MEILTANLVGQVRQATLSGRQHLVAPMTLIVPGILRGSSGSLFYPPEEVVRNTTAWNGIPILLRHPVGDRGQPLSGRTPHSVEKQGIGTVFNAKDSEGNLVAEGWFDLERTKLLAPEVLINLEGNAPTELSTGLFTEKVEAPAGSTHNGESFDFIARRLQPDHLAILPDQTGACSLDDGCGVLLNKKKEDDMSLTEKRKTAAVDLIITNCAYCDETDREVLNALDDVKLLAREEAVKKTIAQEAVLNQFHEMAGEGSELAKLPELVVNKAKEAAKAQFGKDTEEEEEEEDAKNKKAKNAKTKNKKAKNQDDEEEEEDMPTKNTLTEEEWFANAPETVQNTHKHARELENRERTEIIRKLVVNVDKAKQEAVVNSLKGEDLDKLRVLASLVPDPKEVVINRPSFFGGQGGPINNQDQPDDILEVPVLNYEEIAKQG